MHALKSRATRIVVPYVCEAGGSMPRELTATPLGRISEINAYGGFAAAESFARLGADLSARREAFDRRVGARMERGRGLSAAVYIRMHDIRAHVQAEMRRRDEKIDVYVMPTVRIVAPRLEELDDDDSYERLNRLMLRNPSIANLLDLPAISIPCQSDGLPVGLTLMGKSGEDRRLFDIARMFERELGVESGTDHDRFGETPEAVES